MIQTNLAKIQYYGQKNEKKNWKFRSFLKCLDMNENEIDLIVHRINKEVTNDINCKICANCCKEMSPLVLEKEIIRISNRIGISKEDFIMRYLIHNEEENEFIINKKPCPFLNNNQCEIYDVRPQDCKSFPHLEKDEFLSRLIGVVENYSICPIVFNVFERLKETFKFRV